MVMGGTRSSGSTYGGRDGSSWVSKRLKPTLSVESNIHVRSLYPKIDVLPYLCSPEGG